MGILLNMSAITLRESVAGACKICGVSPAADAVQAVSSFLAGHFKDHSERLTRALRKSTDRAWRALEVALAGDSFWDRCKGFLATGEQKGFRAEMQRYLNDLQLPDNVEPEKFRRLCLSELKAARKAGHLDEDLSPEDLARHVGAFARHADPLQILATERLLHDGIVAALKREHYDHLAQLLGAQPRPELSLLTMSVRYFFRRAIEEDEKLFQGLAFAQLEQIQQTQSAGLNGLQQLLTDHGSEMEQMLGDLQAGVLATYNVVLDVQEEQKRQAGQNDEIYRHVIALQQKLDLMRTELRPRDSLSIRGDVERRLAREVVTRYRSLPPDRRQQMPALLNAVGKLQVAAGDYQAAEQDFAVVASLVTDHSAKAEAHHNAWRAALERRDWSAAIRELAEACRLDPRRFEPFPFRKYRPIRILGAGGFGVAFLCHHLRLGTEVVVKTLTADDLDRDMMDVFAEARVLRQMNDPHIIGLCDCDYADEEMKRPYIEMNYFDGMTLEDHVMKHGPLPEPEMLEVARQIALGLRAAHDRGVLHRDVKPANILIRAAASRFEVKIIDFGLALSAQRLAGSLSSHTLAGSSIAGTIDYAAPEQMGRLPGVMPTFASDVYGFGRSVCYGLFKTPHPKAKHFDQLSPMLKRLLDDCIEDDPRGRLSDFHKVLDRLIPPPVAHRRATPVASSAGTKGQASPPAPAPSSTSANSATALGQLGDKATDWFKKAFGTKSGPAPVDPPPADEPQVFAKRRTAVPEPADDAPLVARRRTPPADPPVVQAADDTAESDEAPVVRRPKSQHPRPQG